MTAASSDPIEAFCPVLAELVRTRKAVGRRGKKFEGVAALSSVNNLITLRRLCLALKPERTLEVGMCFGGSALVFTASQRDLQHRPGHQHTALDPFQTSVWDDAGLLAVDRAELCGYLDFRPSFSSLELPRLVAEKAFFDVVYIDGSHLFEDVFVDLYFVSKLLSKGGVVLFDDSSDRHVAKVLRFVRTNFGEILRLFPLDPYRPDKGASFKYRLGKLLGRTQLTAFRKLSVNERSWNAAFRKF